MKLLTVRCDNCDWQQDNVPFDQMEEWLGKRCPDCSTVLVTDKDISAAKAMAAYEKIDNAIGRVVSFFTGKSLVSTKFKFNTRTGLRRDDDVIDAEIVEPDKPLLEGGDRQS